MSERRKQTPKQRGLTMRDIEARLYVRNIGKDTTSGPGHYRWKPKANKNKSKTRRYTYSGPLKGN